MQLIDEHRVRVQTMFTGRVSNRFNETIGVLVFEVVAANLQPFFQQPLIGDHYFHDPEDDVRLIFD